jgi:biopolymer transport protein ExbD
MTWKIRHEGSPRSIEGLSLQQVVEGLQDGLWEPTDEVMGPQDQQWTAIESHPQLAEIAMDLEPPIAKVHDDETRLDMNPLIDVALVLLIFFILTTSYAALQKMLEMPNMSKDKGAIPVKDSELNRFTIRVKLRKEGDKAVIKVENQVVEPDALVAELKKYVKGDKTQVLLDAKGVDWGSVVTVLDAARGADAQRVNMLANPQ